MKKMLLSILLLAMVLLNSAIAQSVALNNQFAVAGTQVVIPVIVQDFDNISAITLDFSYDPAILQYQSFQNPQVFGGFVVNAQNMGSVNWLSITWNDLTNNPNGIYIADGVLINIVFNYTGSESDLDFVINNCTVLKMPDYDELQLITSNGSIREEPDAIVFMLDQFALPGQVKVPLMANFSGVSSGVGSFTFFIIYDETELTFTGLDDIALPPGSVFVNTINNPSRVIVDWVNPDPLGGGYTADGLLLNMVFNYTGVSDTELKFQVGNCVVANNQAYEIDVAYEDAWVFTCPQITADVVTVNPTCVGSKDGSITVSNAAGATSYEVNIGGGWFLLDGSITFNDLEPGAYDVNIRNAIEPVCTFFLGNYQIVDPDPLNVFFTIDEQPLVPFQTNEYCFNTQVISLKLVNEQGGQQATGTPPFSLTFTINGGTPIVLNNLQFGSGINLVGYLPQGQYPGQIAAGSYLVEVTALSDFNECTLSPGALEYYKFTLVINPQPDVFFTLDGEPLIPFQVSEFCYNVDEIILALVSEQGEQQAVGTPPFDFSLTINGGDAIEFSSVEYDDEIDFLDYLPSGPFGFVQSGSYSIQVIDFSDANTCELVPEAIQYYNFTLNIHPQPVVSAIAMQYNPVDPGPEWLPAVGDLSAGYSICLDPVTYSGEYYYLDVNTLLSSTLPEEGFLNPFFLEEINSSGFAGWWADKFLAWNNPAMQAIMEDILAGNEPMFYLKRVNDDFQLIDGFIYQLLGLQQTLQLNADYPAGIYTFSGAYLDENECVSLPFEVLMTFNSVSTYSFDFDVPELVCSETEFEVPVSFGTDIPGSCGYDGVRFKIEADGPGDVTFGATDSNNNYYSFVNSGYWGPQAGFDLPASYSSTTAWDLEFSAPGVYEVTFSLIYAPDNGIVAGITETINIEVSLAPTITACPDMVITDNEEGECGAIVNFNEAQVSGIPAPVVIYTLNEVPITPGHFFPVGVHTVEVSATNECGTDNCSFTVTVRDVEAPVVAESVEVNIECISDLIDPVPPTAIDNCDGLVTGILVNTENTPNPIVCNGTRIYTYEYTDEAENTSYWTHTYNVQRVTSPTQIGEPVANSKTVACLSEAVPPIVTDLPGLETFDNFNYTGSTYINGNFTGEDGIVWNYVHVTGSTAGSGVYEIDGNGMILRRSGDNSKIFSNPIPGGIGNFSVDLRKAWTGGGIRQVELFINGASYGTSIEFGSLTGEDQTVHTFVVNNINIPGDVVIEIRHITGGGSNRQLTVDNISWTPYPGHNGPLVLDVCGNLLIPSEPITIDQPENLTCNGTRIYRYNFGDCAGLAYEWDYTYTILAPVVEMPDNAGMEVACPSLAVQPTAPEVSDNCGHDLELVSLVQTSNNTEGCAGEIVWTATYEDCNGATYFWTYTYTVLAPVVEMPDSAGMDIACLSLAVQPTAPAVSDNCGRDLELVSLVETSNNTEGCAGEIVWTATYEDCNGATYFWTYTYTVLAPVVEMPDNGATEIACPDLAVEPEAPIVADNCGRTLALVSMEITEDNSGGCGGMVIWTATYADCANTLYFWNHIYTILPVTGPVLVDEEVDCSSLDQSGLPYTLSVAESFDPASLIGEVEALYNDNCGGFVTAIVSLVTPGSPTNPNSDESWIFAYEFMITDLCGNSTTCVVTYSGSAVPTTVIVEKGTIRTGEIVCYGATQTITISQLEVFGSLTLIAGESIHLLPGFRVHLNGYLHAYIGDTYCENPVPLVVAKDEEIIAEQTHLSVKSNEDFFRVFPNPTLGSFILKLADIENESTVKVEIYNMLGDRIFINELSGHQQYELNVSDLSPGIYIIRLLRSDKFGTQRLIKK